MLRLALRPTCPQNVVLFLEKKSNFVKGLLPSSGVLMEVSWGPVSWPLSVTGKITLSEQAVCSKVSLQAVSVRGGVSVQ